MRLHLPKRLLHAVIASLVTASAALCTLGSAAYAGYVDSGTDVNTFYLNGNNATDFNQGLSYAPSNTDEDGDYYNAYGTYKNGKYTLNTDPTNTSGHYINTISTGSVVSATIETLNVKNTKTLTIGAGGYGVFTGTGLVIENFNIADSGTATLTVGNANQCHKVTINSVTGTLNVVNYSNLTFASGESAINLGTVTSDNGSISNTGTLNLTGSLNGGSISNTGTLNLTGSLNSGAITNTGTLNLTGAVSMTGDYIKNNIAGTLGEGVVNGCGTVSSFTLSDLFKGGGSVTGGDSVSWTMGDVELTYSNGSLSLGTALTSNIYQINDSSKEWDLSGKTNVLIGENTTVTLSADAGKTPGSGTKITVASGATLDVNGRECTACELVLAGGTLTNTGAVITGGNLQFKSVSLTGNSVISGSNSYGIVAADHGASLLALNGYTLTIDGNFYGITTYVTGGGTINISGATFELGQAVGKGQTAVIADENTTFCLSKGGELSSGKGIQLNHDTTFKAETAEGLTNRNGVGTISAAINTNGNVAYLSATGAQTGTDTTTGDTLKVTGVISGSGSVAVSGDGTVELTGTNTYTGGTTMEGGTLVAGHANALGTGALSVTSTTAKSTLDVASEVTLGVSRILVGESKQVEGVETTTPSALDIKGSTSVSNYVDLTAGSSLTVKQDASLSLTGTDMGKGIWMKTGGVVNIEKGATVSAFGFTIANSSDTTNATLTLAEGQDNANLGRDAENSNLVINGADVTITETYELKSKINGGTLTSDVQGARASGNINVSSLTVNAQKSLALGGETTVTGSATVSGALEIQSTGSLSVGADSTISTLTGSGTLKANGGVTSVTSASGFSGALESGSMLSIGGLKNLETLKAAGNGQVWATTGTDDNSNVITSITIDEIVLTGGTAGVTYTADEATHNAAIETNSLVVSAGSALTADLTLADSASLVVNVGGITADTSTPVCTLSGTLTLGSELTLTLENLGILKEGQSLTLFSGVTSLTFTQPNESGVGTATTATDDITTGEIDASTVFSGLGEDDFWLTYTGSADGGIVALVAQRDVPEPTTATLSLLALMGLAARRRRRKA
ncbi:MAG: PEP-CTERM sorting domain-containing protein [Akkermansia muciniphila]|nr:PEP-CTERM sorting domain-containing protein [Akkermansia muciniphila]